MQLEVCSEVLPFPQGFDPTSPLPPFLFLPGLHLGQALDRNEKAANPETKPIQRNRPIIRWCCREYCAPRLE